MGKTLSGIDRRTQASGSTQPLLAPIPFSEIWAVDFEFSAEPGERPDPICLVAHELKSGRVIKQWREQMGAAPPYPIGPEVLFVAYYVSAEIGCHLALGWQVPERILDLFTEFRNHTNGLSVPAGKGLLGALTHFGLDSIGTTEKEEMRSLAMRGGPWTDAEKHALLDYCASDVDALARLLPALLPHTDLPRALLRGRSMAAAASMEWNGVPLETEMLELFKHNWDNIQDQLIADIDADYGVYDGRTFKVDRFANWLVRKNIPWPCLESGRLDLSDDAFSAAAKVFPEVAPLRELRGALSKMRLADLAVGRDGRNRTMLSAFRATTSRNQPSNTKFIFGPSVWLRGLIKPPPGYGLAYIDWKQQEFGIAAALSADPKMMDAYRSGDPYLAFAIQAGAVPPDATQESHKKERAQFKACSLGVLFGMAEKLLAERICQPHIFARDLLRLHKETYRAFWCWSEAAANVAMTTCRLHTAFGWQLHVTASTKLRSVLNFPMQANGAEMLRLACCMATEEGIEVCAPVHDAVLISAPLDRLDDDIARMRNFMREASRIVLDGFELGTDVECVRYPDRYADPRGTVFWDHVMELIRKQQTGATDGQA